jgi:hypothetical protein
MKLKKKLSTKQFFISQILILIVGLIFLGGLYYILNLQYRVDSNPFSKGPLTSAPKTLRLDLDHPDDNSLSFEPSIIISGKTAPLKEILVFTDTQDLVITSKKDGSFSTVLNLGEGVNSITTAVFDSDGDTKSEQRTVYYSKEKL